MRRKSNPHEKKRATDRSKETREFKNEGRTAQKRLENKEQTAPKRLEIRRSKPPERDERV